MSVRRTIVVAVIALASTASIPAMASTTHRDVTANYTVGGVDGVLSGDSEVQGQESGSAIQVPTFARERSVTIALSDRTGQVAAARIAQDVDGDGQPDRELGTICGKGKFRLSQPGKSLIVYPVIASCAAGPAATTQGVVKVTLAG